MSLFPRQGLMLPVAGGAWRAGNAIVTGDVSFGERASVWFGCVVRGDDAQISIGTETNVQDNSVIHADVGVPNEIGVRTTIGHRCVLHGASVGDRCLIGMGAILLGGSRIGDECIVAAGAVVKENMVVPPRSLVAGVPARIVKDVTEEQVRAILASAAGYVAKVQQYLGDAESYECVE